MAWSRYILLILLACVDKTDFDSGGTAFPLIVDGLFSTKAAEVRLSRGYRVNGGLNYTRIPGAIVWIADTDDPSWKLILKEQKLSFYEYQAFNGTIYSYSGAVTPKAGHHYVLHVIVDSNEFVSLPQEVREPGSIDNIYFTYTSGFNRDKGVEEDGLNILFDATVPSGEDRHFQWRMFGTFSVLADPAAGPERCWVTEREDAPLLSSSAFATRYAGLTARYVPITFDRFNDRYRVEIRQYEISREVWEFTEALRFQLKNGSSLFQPPFFVRKGNVISLNGQANVIGIFTASIDVSRAIYIKRSDLPRELYGQPLPANCLRVYPGSVAYPPPFWM